jgi:serine/threonine protein kinase/tetratricopeptide (TPR) repeat protein
LEKARALGRQSAHRQEQQPLNQWADATELSALGPYRLVKRIGEGGMGTVWLAEQTSPVKRVVAVKFIKAGLANAQGMARFEAERHALALMDHPNIARVLDAGTVGSEQQATSSENAAAGSLPNTGRPYFVMEFVKGVAITEHCDTQRLSIRQRLELFLKICDAVQHAHQKGIVHRDLKPSNVLVTDMSGMATPKIIDFGVAKAIGQKLTEETLSTGVGQLLGTLEYMSPEQVELNAVDIDTRSDIYALGVLLYQLLTGSTPFTREQLRLAPLADTLRLIREVEPPRPSTRVMRSSAGTLAELAALRSIEPAKLPRMLRSDLDWLVMKSIEKDRGRRYETASSLALDVQRYLRDEVVLAGPPNRAYQLRKFVKRHRTALGAAMVMLAALIAGIIGTTCGLLEARRERDAAEVARRDEVQQRLSAQEQRNRAQKAEQQAQANELKAKDEQTRSKQSEKEAKAVLDFFTRHVLDTAIPEGPYGGLGIHATLRAALDAAEPRISSAFADQPLVEAAIRNTMGTSYLHSGEPGPALPQLQRAYELRKLKLGAEHRDTLTTMSNLAAAYLAAGRLHDAVSCSEETLALRSAALGPEDVDTVLSMNNLGVVYLVAGRSREALELLLKTVESRKTKLGAHHSQTLGSIGSLANAYLNEGKISDALALLEPSLEMARDKLSADHPTTLSLQQNLGHAFAVQERFKDAQALFLDTLELHQKVLGEDHAETLKVTFCLAITRLKLGQFREALKLLDEAIPRSRKKLGPEHPLTLEGRHTLANVYLQTGRPKEAATIFEETYELRHKQLGAGHPATLATMNQLAMAYRASGRGKQALPLFEESLQLCRSNLGATHPDTLSALTNLAYVYKQEGRLQEALKLGQENLELHRQAFGGDDIKTLRVMNNLAFVHFALKRYQAAELLWSAAAASARRQFGFAHPDTQAFTAHWADSLEKTDLPKAEPVRRELALFWKDKTGADSTRQAEHLLLWGKNLLMQRKHAEAEPVLRECLALGQKEAPQAWANFVTMSMLGGSLLGQQQFAAAEPLLLQSFKGLDQKLSEIPTPARFVVTESLERIIELYEGWNKPEEAQRWRKELEKRRGVS